MAVVRRGKIHLNIFQLGSFDVCKKKSRVAHHFSKHFSNLSDRKATFELTEQKNRVQAQGSDLLSLLERNWKQIILLSLDSIALFRWFETNLLDCPCSLIGW